MCCTWLPGKPDAKMTKKSPSAHHRASLSISSQLRHVSTIGKKLVKEQYLRHMSLQYGELGLLAPEICWRVWVTAAYFNGFYVLAALLHGTLEVGISQNLRP